MKLWWVSIPLLTTLNQTCIKLLAGVTGELPLGREWFIAAVNSPFILAMLACEVTSFAIWMKILAKTDVSRAVPMTAVAYIMIVLVSWFGFKEQILLLQIIGGSAIMAGVWLIGTAAKTEEIG